MDLRSIINNEAGESSATKHAAPVTPIQASPAQSLREYSHPSQAPRPGKHHSQDYGVQQTGAPYATATPNNHAINYRPPPPPPIQAPPKNDLGPSAGPYPNQSPYQHTPQSANQYPFPQSPVQTHQYPPSVQQREQYPHSTHPPHLQTHNSVSQGSPPPQTPPVGIPGAAHPYLQHQRSQSSISSTTPTSAQSQQQYFAQYPQDSPVSGGQFPSSQIPQHQRQLSQQSQPGTPLGPPLTQRSSTGAYPQPPSPYQQRGLSSGSYSQLQQTSPAPPAPPSVPRLPSTPTGYDSQRTSLSEQHTRSHSERERSLSVSPKTRLPSQTRGGTATPKSENGYFTTSKRKLEDREVSIDETRRTAIMDIQTHTNGDSRLRSGSPQQPPRKRVRYTEPPIWAQSVRTKGSYPSTGRSSFPKVNGKQPAQEPQPHSAASIMAEGETNGNHHAASTVLDTADSMKERISAILGPWEESITGKKPYEQVSRLVADFIYTQVISRTDLGELSSRGVQVEIEAKLGQLIDKDTNQRYHLPIRSECVLGELARVGFRSSMTETQHRSLNDFLNLNVAETHPGNPKATGRVKINYLHRRETDRFYELPPQMQAQLPPAVRQLLNPRHATKVRVTHDQKTGDVLAKIIKARISDLDIYNPEMPLDCRISINLETRFDGDIDDLIANRSQRSENSLDRNKDRLSYTQSLYQIDLTQVTQTTVYNGQSRSEKEHELEIEVATAAIMEQGRRVANHQPNEYMPLIEGFLDNVRVLQRNVAAQ